MFDTILSGGPGGEVPRESRGVWGPRGPPMRGMVGGGDSQWIVGDDTISGDGQGWVDLYNVLVISWSRSATFLLNCMSLFVMAVRRSLKQQVINPPFGEGKNGRMGGSKNPTFFPSGMIPSPGMVR